MPNSLFGDVNPYAETVDGDWLMHPTGTAKKHLGEVYLEGRSFYEVATPAEVAEPQRRTHIVDHWTGVTVPTHEPDQTVFVWCAEVTEESTTIWANFHGADPNEALVEINVRRSVFFPERNHVDWITVRGFEMAHAATPWAPPTADQPGLIGPNWAKGWIIEDNVIHDAKCSAISLGKEISTGHNFSTERRDKPGYQYQLESVFSARQIGWDRERIGSHIVRRNTIFDCGQTGVVGHLGCAFSTIEDNHISRIALKREFFGHEIAGIKLHAALDTTIEHNRIQDCSLGIWLDWQTQGTRVTRNLLFRNNRDFFIEVSHGPHIVDHNILASPAAVEVVSQGGAFVHNLISGTVRLEPVLDRATPYHRAHSTEVSGYATIVGGDDRWTGNLFFSGEREQAYQPGGFRDGRTATYGTSGYDEYPSSFAEYLDRLDPKLGDHERFLGIPLPVSASANAYVGGATAFRAEDGGLEIGTDSEASVAVIEEGEEVYLELQLPDAVDELRVPEVSGRDLGCAHFPDVEFEERDGTPARFDRDLLGTEKSPEDSHPAGPLAALRAGQSRVRVW